MKKTMILAVALMALTWLLAGCGGAKLADVYDKDEVTDRAKDMVELINDRDYEAVAGEVREDLRDQLTPDILSNAWDAALDKSGAFEDYKSVTVIGQKNRNSGEDYAVVVLVGKYENASRTFTIMMDENLDIVGLYMK